MTTEEKAKAWDEAIERAKSKIRNDKDHVLYEEDILDIFPSLKESDERIRKEIVNFINHKKAMGSVTPEESKRTGSWVAWLERRGEQNPVVVIPKFRVGDVIRLKGSTAEYTIESISGECYHGKGWGLYIGCEEDYELVEQNPAWSEEDEDNMMMIEDRLSDYLDYIREDTSLTKHQKNSMKEEVIGYVNWLKSLKGRAKPQSTWKPSEEQIEALNRAMYHVEDDVATQIAKLIGDLKKLRDSYEGTTCSNN